MLRGFSAISSQIYSLSAGLNVSALRKLYSAAALGVDGYINSREKVKGNFISNADNFRKKMQEFTATDSKQMVFSEDLKNMIHLAEKEDTPLVMKMLKKFAKQNKELRFGTYVFGPVVMRMFHYIGDEQAALECFKDKELDGFFSQWMSYQILLDMLYEKGKYQEVLDAYEIIKQQQVEGSMFPKHAMVIVFASCYKINTEASFKYVMSLWKEMVDAGHSPMRRTATFAAALALSQNAPHAALEILYASYQQNYITVRNMKILAMLELERTEDVIPILRSALEAQSPNLSKQTFCREVIDRTRQAISKMPDTAKELKMDYERIEKFLIDHGHITDETLDKLLCTEISTSITSTMASKNQAVLNASFSRNQRGPKRSRFTRPGLAELY